MRKVWITPVGSFPSLYADMLKQPHLLIAGATGSGKSVVINGLIYTALYNAPSESQFILIDVKRVELCEYKRLPHTIAYADDVPSAIAALEKALAITEKRFKAMQCNRQRKYSGSDVYVIIDEFADLMTTAKRYIVPLIQRLCQIGRAANVHVIAATQCPIAQVIPTQIKVNFDSRVALRTRSAQDSRNILGCTGCERLPRYGKGYYMTPEGLRLYNIPLIDDSQRQKILEYWGKHKKPRFTLTR